jgi:hypothetical protein
VDDRTFYRVLDRAIVEVLPGPGRVWEKLYPSRNIYDAQVTSYIYNCLFDPIDDGNDEDSRFDSLAPGAPLAPGLGPSSTCYPEYSFVYLGDTGDPYAPGNTGRASDGPALAGSLGPGSWVETRFDLSRYRGRGIKIRFLYTTVQDWDPSANRQTHWDILHDGVGPGDDGWYIDNLRVTQTLGLSSPTAVSDHTDNDPLGGNLDRDARGDECDCAPSDPTAFAYPAEVALVRFPTDRTTLTWQPTQPLYGIATVHDVLRGLFHELPVGSGGSETCVASETSAASFADPGVPPLGTGYWYLIRARSPCGIGGYGSASDGTPRASGACP